MRVILATLNFLHDAHGYCAYRVVRLCQIFIKMIIEVDIRIKPVYSGWDRDIIFWILNQYSGRINSLAKRHINPNPRLLQSTTACSSFTGNTYLMK